MSGIERMMSEVEKAWRRRFARVLEVHPDIEERIVAIADKLAPIGGITPDDWLDQLTKIAIMDKLIEDVTEGQDAGLVVRRARRFIAKNWRNTA